MEKEREIYIKDMLFYILRKWRIILVWMIIFAVAADGFSALKSYKSVIKSQQEQASPEEELETAKEGLSEDDIKKVEDTYDSYLTYKKILDNSIDYYNNSIKMNIDPNHVATTSIQYYINNTKSLKDIVEAYSNIILSEDVCKKISEKADLNADESYISELISFNLNTDDNKLTLEENVDEKLMTVSIIAQNKDDCEIIADIVENEIQEETPRIQKEFKDFQIKKINRSYNDKADNNLLNTQQNLILNLNSIKTSISNLNVTLSEAQMNYYNLLINYNEKNIKKIDENENISFQLINLKYIILGLIIGAFLSMCWYALCYIIDNRLKLEDEVEEYYKVPVLGTVQSEKTMQLNNNFIDRYLLNIFKKKREQSNEEIIHLISAKILLNAKKKNMSRIHIAGADDSELVKMIKRQLSDELQKGEMDLKCSVGNSLIHDVNSLNVVADAEGIILIEEVGKSDFNEIGKEINICTDNSILLVGTVIVD